MAEKKETKKVVSRRRKPHKKIIVIRAIKPPEESISIKMLSRDYIKSFEEQLIMTERIESKIIKCISYVMKMLIRISLRLHKREMSSKKKNFKQ